jgi:putative restriction endonuclease
MEYLADLLTRLTEQHRAALGWFVENAGTEQPWPGPLPDGTLLATRAKGIYKPTWSEYAISVRETLDSPYPDRDPAHRDDGTWTYRYYQEGRDPLDRDASYANRGLLACCRDRVPVGVMVQVSRRPHVRYKILGVALVTGWESGYFLLEGTIAGYAYGLRSTTSGKPTTTARGRE